MDKIIKFSHPIGKKKLTLTYYQNKSLKKIGGIKKSTYPFYIMINFNSRTMNVRSMLWKRLIETANAEFAMLAPFENKPILIEAFAEIEHTVLNNKDTVKELCEYEFECFKRILPFSKKNTVSEIVESYNFWGEDALRELCYNLIFKITDKKRDWTRGGSSISYKEISHNAAQLLNYLLKNCDPVSVFCLIQESGIYDNVQDFMDSSLAEAYDRAIYLISYLINEAKYFDNFQTKLGTETRMPYGIYYFPKIHFLYPPGGNKRADVRTYAIDEILQKMDIIPLSKFINLEKG